MPIWKQHNVHGASLTSFRHDKERAARRKNIFAVILGIAVIMFVLRSPLEHVLASVAQIAFRPIFVAQNSLSDALRGYGYYFTSKKSISEENAHLRDALDLIAVEGYSREALRRENDELKKALGRYPDRSLLLARVLANPGNSPFDTLVVDVGSRDGIQKGMSVFGDGDFMLGEVTQVFLYSSVVTLYSSSGNELSAIIGATSTPVTAYGVGGGNFRIILPKGVDVKEGELVEIPVLSPTYLGTVLAVVKPEGSSLQEVHVQWPLNISELRYVYIEDTMDGRNTKKVN